MDFLQRGLELGLAYNTLKVHLSSLASLTKTCWAVEPIIIQLMTGAEKIRLPRRTLFPKWDLTRVLNMLLLPPFDPPHACSLWHLTLRTVVFLAITSSRRVSELHALSIKEPFLIKCPSVQSKPFFLKFPRISTAVGK